MAALVMLVIPLTTITDVYRHDGIVKSDSAVLCNINNEAISNTTVEIYKRDIKDLCIHEYSDLNIYRLPLHHGYRIIVCPDFVSDPDD